MLEAQFELAKLLNQLDAKDAELARLRAVADEAIAALRRMKPVSDFEARAVNSIIVRYDAMKGGRP